MSICKQKEEWAMVKDYPAYYVSNWGRIYSLKRHKLLAFNTDDPTNYARVHLTNKDGVKIKSVHRLVAEAFIPNPDNLPIINHKDEVKCNNYFENLEWCDTKYNTTYSIGKRVRDLSTGIIYPSAREAGRQLDIPFSNICKVCRGKRNSAGGKKFEFVKKT